MPKSKAKGPIPLTLSPDPTRNLFQKKCVFTEHGVTYIDYKNFNTLRKFINYYAKIKPRYYTGVSPRHQKMLSQAVKRARFMGLLPFCR